MIAAWMLYSAAVGVLSGAAAWAGDRFCRLLNLPVRWVWIGGMLGTLFLSSAALVRMSSVDAPAEARVDVNAVPAEFAEPEQSGYLTRLAGAIRSSVSSARAAGAAMAERTYAAVGGDTRVARSLVLAWGVFSGVLLLLFGATLTRLHRARTRWRAHRIGSVGVLVSPDVGPALVGLRRPSIVVPEWLLAEPAERQWLVVQHEDEHRRAGDHAMLSAACMSVCLLPWNPTLWWMLLRTRLAVELDCDSRVLRRGVKARSYGSLLLEIAGRTRARPFGAPALADSPTHLERRLIAMTENTRRPQPARAAAMALSALLLGVAACTADLPTSAAIEDMDVTEVQLQAEQAGILVPLTDDDGPLFVIDGVVATQQDARALAPESIARIEVVKAAAATQAYGERGAGGVVYVTTHAAEYVATREGYGATSPGAEAAVTREGDPVPLRASEGSVAVTSAEREARVRRQAASTQSPEFGTGPDSPLIIVDGVIAPASLKLSSLSRETIERVEILKGAAARVLYEDPRAANGVILITTKPAAR